MTGTAWEVERRPAQPCVVCREPPERHIVLPRLPGVHRAFASSAICGPCWAAAQQGDLGVLTERAERGWVDDADVVPDAVDLALAAAGQALPSRPAPPPELRDPAPRPLSGEDARLWTEIEPLIFDGPSGVVVRGAIEQFYDGERSVTLVQLAGARARLCDQHGEPWLVTDGVTMWRRGEDGMIASEYTGAAWAGDGSELAHHRSREQVELFGFGRPIGPIERTEYLGRTAWRFAFAAPAHKPYDMRVVVDASTGLMLEQRFGERSIARWTSFVTEQPIDPAVFIWDGPVRTAEELRVADIRDHEADLTRRRDWFHRHVTDQALSNAGRPIEVLLHDWHDDGGFQASLNGGLDGVLARRPRSDQWWDLGWPQVTHRWSDQRWDWALSVWGDHDCNGFDEDAFTVLRRALGSSPSPP